MDIAAEAIRQTTNVPPLNLDFVGRWVIGLKDGKLAHDSIAAAPAYPTERAVGIASHYLIGMGFAGMFDFLLPQWSKNPKLGLSVLLGLSTTVAPWFIMQPAFGLGVAASKTPKPGVAMFRSLRAHASYGAGLYIGAQLLRAARSA
ncbi:hypothetical protein CFREI_06415 [Corynebacterium freiburgense]|nr:hypothetical protein CFREI_06415 [Corynebacterium freiburgense]